LGQPNTVPSSLEVLALWRCVGAAAEARLRSHGGFWLSTHGGGVPWLHVRLDDQPKYFHGRWKLVKRVNSDDDRARHRGAGVDVAGGGTGSKNASKNASKTAPSKFTLTPSKRKR
jgi:hypothetical protein